MKHAALLLLSLTAAGCAAGRLDSGHRTMPSPEGCFIHVWDAPRYGGRGDYINGPASYIHLRDMPGRRRWDNRIRSARVGPDAIATAYADENLSGTSTPLHRDANYPDIRAMLGEGVESLRIDCSRSAE